MYNRYVRNDDGVYTRIPQDEPGNGPPGGSGSPPPPGRPPSGGPPPSGGAPPPGPETGPPPPGPERRPPPGPEMGTGPHGPPPPGGNSARPDGLTGILRRLLDQLHLDHVDTGDLLLLALLFFLFREGADEELLVALGLLLIL